MEKTKERPDHRDRSLQREIGQSLYLLALTALVSAAFLGLGLLAIWTLD
jgi:hypothetical protein